MADNYYSISSGKGSVNISDDVIAALAAATVADVEGVTGLANVSASDFSDFIGRKTVAKGVKVSFEDNRILIDVSVMVRYGTSIAGIAAKAQSAVSAAVGSMVGAEPCVNVHVAGISFDK